MKIFFSFIFLLLSCSVFSFAEISKISVSVPNKKENLGSIQVSHPTILEIPFASSALLLESKSSAECSLLLHIRDAVPEAKYEARVSFAGSPPMKYDLSIVNLISVSISSSQQSRTLLDTERVQFETGKRSTKAKSSSSKEKEEESTSLTSLFSNMVSPDKKKIIFPISERNENEHLENIGLCIKFYKNFGVPSQEFYEDTKSDSYKVKFVVTVDRMLFGALPTSAIPSVFVAAAYAIGAIVFLLPRVLKAV
jgi:hypothetical protein